MSYTSQPDTDKYHGANHGTPLRLQGFDQQLCPVVVIMQAAISIQTLPAAPILLLPHTNTDRNPTDTLYAANLPDLPGKTSRRRGV